MYSVTGTFNGKTLTREVIGGDELAQLFKAEKILKRKDIDFKVVAERLKKDRNGNGMRMNDVVSVPCKFSGIYNGSQVEVQYFEQEVRKGEGPLANIKRTPKKFRFNAPKTTLNPEEKEKVLLYYLHPLCKNSPLNNGKEAIYQLDMPEVDAARDMVNVDNILEMGTLIRKTENMGMLRRKAKGLKIRVGKEVLFVSNVDKMADEEVRTSLIKIALAHPQEFKREWEDENTDFEGAIRDALDHGVIALKTIAGTKAFYWSKDQGGSMICRVGDGVEAFTVLKRYVISNFSTIFPRLQAALADTDGGQLMENMRQSEIMQRLNIEGDKPDKVISDIDSLTPENLYQVGLDNDIFYYDRGLKKFFWLKDDGELGKAFFDVVEPKTYRTDLQYLFKADKKVRSELIKRIKAKLE